MVRRVVGLVYQKDYLLRIQRALRADLEMAQAQDLTMKVLAIVTKNLAEKADPDKTSLFDAWDDLPGQTTLLNLAGTCKEMKACVRPDFCNDLEFSVRETFEDIKFSDPQFFMRAPRQRGKGAWVDQLAMNLGYDFQPDDDDDLAMMIAEFEGARPRSDSSSSRSRSRTPPRF